MVQPVRCPRDGAEARIEEHPGRLIPFKLDVCPTCRGIFFDRGEIGKLTNDHDLERLLVEYSGGLSRMKCPRCDGPMSPRPVGEVTIDVCGTCRGVWMDRGELEAAARTLGHPPSEGSFAETHAGELATRTFLGPSLREALASPAWTGPFRPA